MLCVRYMYLDNNEKNKSVWKRVKRYCTHVDVLPEISSIRFVSDNSIEIYLFDYIKELSIDIQVFTDND